MEERKLGNSTLGEQADAIVLWMLGVTEETKCKKA
jgi:hypothetical protein